MHQWTQWDVPNVLMAMMRNLEDFKYSSHWWSVRRLKIVRISLQRILNSLLLWLIDNLWHCIHSCDVCCVPKVESIRNVTWTSFTCRHDRNREIDSSCKFLQNQSEAHSNHIKNSVWKIRKWYSKNFGRTRETAWSRSKSKWNQ